MTHAHTLSLSLSLSLFLSWFSPTLVAFLPFSFRPSFIFTLHSPPPFLFFFFHFPLPTFALFLFYFLAPIVFFSPSLHSSVIKGEAMAVWPRFEERDINDTLFSAPVVSLCHGNTDYGCGHTSLGLVCLQHTSVSYLSNQYLDIHTCMYIRMY